MRDEAAGQSREEVREEVECIKDIVNHLIPILELAVTYAKRFQPSSRQGHRLVAPELE